MVSSSEPRGLNRGRSEGGAFTSRGLQARWRACARQRGGTGLVQGIGARGAGLVIAVEVAPPGPLAPSARCAGLGQLAKLTPDYAEPISAAATLEVCGATTRLADSPTCRACVLPPGAVPLKAAARPMVARAGGVCVCACPHHSRQALNHSRQAPSSCPPGLAIPNPRHLTGGAASSAAVRPRQPPAAAQPQEPRLFGVQGEGPPSAQPSAGQGCWAARVCTCRRVARSRRPAVRWRHWWRGALAPLG